MAKALATVLIKLDDLYFHMDPNGSHSNPHSLVVCYFKGYLGFYHMCAWKCFDKNIRLHKRL